ncbi:MAG TPA: hypothetical protein VMW87_10030, partial [Spirochaetia bacterium]|nr:hypothetical protein [Spirochaetia bacterium]
MTIRQRLLLIVIFMLALFAAAVAAYFLIRAPINRIDSEQEVLTSLGRSIRNETIQLNRISSADFPTQLAEFKKASTSATTAFGNLDSLKVLPTAAPSIRESVGVIRNLKTSLDKGVSEFLISVINIQTDAQKAGLDPAHFTLFSLTTYDVMRNKGQADAITGDAGQLLSQLNTLSMVMQKSVDIIDQQNAAIESQIS